MHSQLSRREGNSAKQKKAAEEEDDDDEEESVCGAGDTLFFIYKYKNN